MSFPEVPVLPAGAVSSSLPSGISSSVGVGLPLLSKPRTVRLSPLSAVNAMFPGAIFESPRLYCRVGDSVCGFHIIFIAEGIECKVYFLINIYYAF